jgi:GTP cyclohydrolase III
MFLNGVAVDGTFVPCSPERKQDLPQPATTVVVAAGFLAGITQAEQPRSSVSKAKRALQQVRADEPSGAHTVGTFWMKPEHRDERQNR